LGASYAAQQLTPSRHTTRFLRLFATLLLLAGASRASHAQRRSSATCDGDAVQQSVCLVDDSLGIALVRADTAALARLYADDLVSINYRGIRSTKTTLIAAIAAGRLRFDTLLARDRHVEVAADSAMLVERMHQVATGSEGRHPAEVDYRRTYKRHDDRWQLVAAVIGVAPPPIRVVVARLTHDHVGRVWSVPHPDVEIVGVYEPNAALVDRLAPRFGFNRSIVYSDMKKMLDAVKPDAVVAFGSIYEHLEVVEAAAPRGVHVMVEKPLAVSNEHARRIETLAKRYKIHVLTNYETTWYPSMEAAHQLVQGDSVIGPLRKLVVHDGHQGPKEIGVSSEFLEWLTDPVKNGGGALIDFGCYGADLVTWLMNGQLPLTVTAVTQQMKPSIYPKVDDEATIVLTYPKTQAIIQGSWNWPMGRKDIEVYGAKGYLIAPNATSLRLRRGEQVAEESITPAPRSAPSANEFQFLAAVVRGRYRPAETDPSSLAINVTVVRILDAARRSASTGKTVRMPIDR
jgi:predicted dehydrogenase/ketosteroid isomerase-like protein